MKGFDRAELRFELALSGLAVDFAEDGGLEVGNVSNARVGAFEFRRLPVGAVHRLQGCRKFPADR